MSARPEVSGSTALPLHASAASAGITLVTGCEISCQWQRRSIHVVGLNLDLASSDFGRAMTIQAQAREDRAEKITEVLQRLGLDVTLPQVQTLAGAQVVAGSAYKTLGCILVSARPVSWQATQSPHFVKVASEV